MRLVLDHAAQTGLRPITAILDVDFDVEGGFKKDDTFTGL